MTNCALFTAIGIICIAITSESALVQKPSRVRCGCFAMCEKKYSDEVKTTSDDGVQQVKVSALSLQKVSACRRGCRYYHVMNRLPKRNPPSEMNAEDKLCGDSSAGVFSFTVDEKKAYLDGCRNGCEPSASGGVQARVRVTIYLEDDSQDGSEGEQPASDPAFRQQYETRFIAIPGETHKIPESYFTNLPIVREQDAPCCKPRFCDWNIRTERFMKSLLGAFLTGSFMVFGYMIIKFTIRSYTQGEYSLLPQKARVTHT